MNWKNGTVREKAFGEKVLDEDTKHGGENLVQKFRVENCPAALAQFMLSVRLFFKFFTG